MRARVLIGYSRCLGCGAEPACEAKSIKGFPAYEVLACGHIASHHKRTPHILVGGLDAKGYLLVTLSGGGHRRQDRIHRLVAEAFHPNPERLPCVRHLDGRPTNNSKDNLAWGTYTQNEADKRRHGTWHARRNNKLNEQQVRRIRQMARGGARHVVIAERFKVSRATVTRAVNGTTWRELE